MPGPGSEAETSPTHHRGRGAADGERQGADGAEPSASVDAGGDGELDGAGDNGLGKSKTLNSDIQQLKARRDALKIERAKVRKELRNTQRRRQRLLKATRRLSADDLRKVLIERAEAAAAECAAGSNEEQHKSAAGASNKPAGGATAP